MSVFWPVAKAVTPQGREWKIYAYRVQWQKPPRARDTWKSVVAAVRTVRSENWTIDAVSHMPPATVHTWTTTSQHRGQVLAQVEGGLARGDVPIHLRNGDYRGSRSAR